VAKSEHAPEAQATSPDQFQHAVFEHSNAWATVAGGVLQLGGYFKDAPTLVQALNQWGALGYTVPNIAVSWEQFPLGLGKAQGYRIRNGDAPVVTGSGVSAVIAVRRLGTA
jgi:hypothetical protein